MTPRVMVQHIWNNLSDRAGCCLDCWDMDIQEECLSEITAVIQQAVDQARKEGFEQAREMAANCINELWISASDHTAQSFVDNCQIVIRALQPPREGAE